MRVVLDTNVIVSAALTTHGPCGRILDLLGEAVFEICVDDRILDEYVRVLRRPELGINPDDRAAVLDLLRSLAQVVPAVPLAVKLPDADDMPFLEVAAAAEAVLVTGNARHFPSRVSAGVLVLTPAEFIEVLRHSG